MSLYFNPSEEQQTAAIHQIQPGSIILFSGQGRNRPARIQDRLIMLGQALFKKEYRPGSKRANAGITHVAVCVGHAINGEPIVVEINRYGRNRHPLSYCFWYKNIRTKFGLDPIFKFRPMHIFHPTNEVFRSQLVATLNESSIQNDQKRFRWVLSKGFSSLLKLRRTQQSGYHNHEEKRYLDETICSEFIVRCMKKAAQRSKPEELIEPDPIKPYYPDIPSNVCPSSLLSYLLDKVDGENPLYTHDIHLDIDPYLGLKAVIEQQISRLQQTRWSNTTGQTKAGLLQTAYTQACQKIESDAQPTDSLTKAKTLFTELSAILQSKRTSYNPFKQSTAFLAAKASVESSEDYVKFLR